VVTTRTSSAHGVTLKQSRQRRLLSLSTPVPRVRFAALDWVDVRELVKFRRTGKRAHFAPSQTVFTHSRLSAQYAFGVTSEPKDNGRHRGAGVLATVFTYATALFLCYSATLSFS